MTEAQIYFVSAGLMLMVGLWLLYLGLFGDRSRGRARCPRCWYDLCGLDEVTSCPECGRAIKSTREMYRTRRRWAVAVLGAVVLSGVWYSDVVRWRIETDYEAWREAWIPTTALLPCAYGGNDEIIVLLLNRASLSSEGGRRVWVWQQWLTVSVCNRMAFADAMHSRAFIYGLARSRLQHKRNVQTLINGLDTPARLNCFRVLHFLKPGDLRDLPNDRVLRICEALPTYYSSEDMVASRDYFLSELIRRRDVGVIKCLSEHLNSFRLPPYNPELEVLLSTTIHRIRNEPEPFFIEIVNKEGLECDPGWLPRVRVRLSNRNDSARKIGFASAPAFATNFDVVVRRTSDGQVVSKSAIGLSPPTSGLQQLEVGESNDVELQLRHYVQTFPRGEYLVTIQYHPDINLKPHYLPVESLILLESAPIRLTVWR